MGKKLVAAITATGLLGATACASVEDTPDEEPVYTYETTYEESLTNVRQAFPRAIVYEFELEGGNWEWTLWTPDDQQEHIVTTDPENHAIINETLSGDDPGVPLADIQRPLDSAMKEALGEGSGDAYVEEAEIVLHDNYVAWDIELSDGTEVVISSHDLEILDSEQ